MKKQTGAVRADIAIISIVMGILMVLFLPIPKALLDVLLISNLSMAFLILLLTFIMDKPLEFSTFPALLLIATLFRLSLNISATRLILHNGDAGHVISAIGNYVVGGNYVIGLVVFFILIIVQYVVITNGAQRVAEVAARFTLDSLPGKQMSIDADLNMGLIDDKVARKRRHALEQEANFYGAMDGASKFVKGDAIAGILIILIDIIGGLAVGLVQLSMTWSEALQRFTLLTVGDGIVTQIPALIISVATGIIITRAATDDGLGSELGKQILRYPGTLLGAVGVLCLLCLVPGMPKLPVLLLVSILLALFYTARRQDELKASKTLPTAEQNNEVRHQDTAVVKYAAIELVCHDELLTQIEATTSQFMVQWQHFRQQFHQHLGYTLPALQLSANTKLKLGEYQIKIRGATVSRNVCYLDKMLAINVTKNQQALTGIQTKEPTYGLDAIWIAHDLIDSAKQMGFSVVESESVILTHLTQTVKKYAGELFTRAQTEKYLEEAKTICKGLIDELIPSQLSVTELQRVLQHLLSEGVSIHAVELIFEQLVQHSKQTKDTRTLCELLRQGMSAIIYDQLIGSHEDLAVIALDPRMEQQIMSSAVSPKGTFSLPPEFIERFLQQLMIHASQLLKMERTPILICMPPLRQTMKMLADRVLPQMMVVSLAELPSFAKVRTVGMVKILGEQN